MKHLLISLVVLWAVFQMSSPIGSSKGQPPITTFTRLLEPPPHRLTSPYENGYFYLLGFAVAAALDPAKIGHAMWVETTTAPDRHEFNYSRPDRSELQIALSAEQLLPSWDSDDPVRAFRFLNAQAQALTSHNHTFVMRYERWLAMPFEDMGFGHRGTPRFVEIFVAHRLYVADGFSRQTSLGMQRLKEDIRMWRSVLRDARTIATKVMAQTVITDDLHLLSALLSQSAVDNTVLAMTPDIAPPLTQAELSLRWPLQHQFTLGAHTGYTGELATDRNTASFNPNEQWLARTAHLPEQAFRHIAHPHGPSFLGISLQTRETWEMHAAHYDAMIHATETGQRTLPTLRELPETARPGIIESLVSPAPFDPDWGPFLAQLRETDARLRLASLQVVLRRPSAQTTVPNRLAEVGSAYYDPFSGLPMLWSPTQQKIYSVGKDRLDDGGDADFDISVPAMVAFTSAPKESHRAAPTSRTTRR